MSGKPKTPREEQFYRFLAAVRISDGEGVEESLTERERVQTIDERLIYLIQSVCRGDFPRRGHRRIA